MKDWGARKLVRRGILSLAFVALSQAFVKQIKGCRHRCQYRRSYLKKKWHVRPSRTAFTHMHGPRLDYHLLSGPK